MTVALKLFDLFKALFHFGWDDTKPGLWTLDWTMDWTLAKWLELGIRLGLGLGPGDLFFPLVLQNVMKIFASVASYEHSIR